MTILLKPEMPDEMAKKLLKKSWADYDDYRDYLPTMEFDNFQQLIDETADAPAGTVFRIWFEK